MFIEDNSSFGILIQARSNSTRLEGKIFLPLTIQNQTKSVLEWIYFRVQLSKIKNLYVIIPEEDLVLIEFCKKHNLSFLTGPLEDVRERYIQTAEFLNLKYIIRVTADNPFVEPSLIIPTFLQLLEKKLDLFSFIGLPLGVSVEGFTLDALKRNKELYQENLYKEHVSLHIKKHPNQFRFEHQIFKKFELYLRKKLLSIKDKNQYIFFKNTLPRLTLDEPLDYETFKEIYPKLNIQFTIFDVMDLFFSKPELFLKNLYVEQKRF